MINLEALSQLVWELRFLSMASQTAHWRVFGPTSYSDHLLYGRVYEKLNELLDPLAERLTAFAQMEDRKYVSPLEQARYVHMRMTDAMPRLQEALEDPNLTAAFFYNELLSLTRRMRSFASDVGHGEDMTFGLEDMLAATASDMETLVYFLERRAQVLLKPGGGVQASLDDAGPLKDPDMEMAAQRGAKRWHNGDVTVEYLGNTYRSIFGEEGAAQVVSRVKEILGM